MSLSLLSSNHSPQMAIDFVDSLLQFVGRNLVEGSVWADPGTLCRRPLARASERSSMRRTNLWLSIMTASLPNAAVFILSPSPGSRIGPPFEVDYDLIFQ